MGTLGPDEQKVWHSHVVEVKSGVLTMPTPSTHKGHEGNRENLETGAMKEAIGWYGKTWHFWEVDKGHELPLGHPKLMGSLTRLAEMDTDEVLKDKNTRGDVGRKDKAKKREGIKESGIHENADWYWKEAMEKNAGIFAS
jgi:hypothetical protein